MSAKNRRERKALRREFRATKDELNEVIGNAQPSGAKYGVCQVTGRKTVVDKEYSISQPAWMAIMDYQFKMEKANGSK